MWWRLTGKSERDRGGERDVQSAILSRTDLFPFLDMRCSKYCGLKNGNIFGKIYTLFTSIELISHKFY